jgi:hypothetical protein
MKTRDHSEFIMGKKEPLGGNITKIKDRQLNETNTRVYPKFAY